MKRTRAESDEKIDRRLRQRAFRVSLFSSVAAGRSKQGRLSPVSQNHDEALAAAFEK